MQKTVFKEKDKNLLFLNSSMEEILRELEKIIGYKFRSYHLINKNRYAIVYGSPNIAILLKTEPFFTFGYKFREFGEKGVGDTINCEYLSLFVRAEVRDIYIKFRDGKLYTIPLMEFLEKSHRWIQKEGTMVRSINIHRLKRVN